MTGKNPHSTVSSTALMVALCVATLASLGCRSERDGLEPEATGPGACAGTCHGEGSDPAPPTDLDGHSETEYPGVGAHQFHLRESSTHAAIACASCHVVPERTEDPGHADDARPADLVFGGLAVTGGRTPSYDPATRSCADTYCHNGPTTSTAQWPGEAVWINPRDSEAACGKSCHTTPPGGSHPVSDSCELCHAETAGPNMTIIDRSKHIDGQLQVSASGCAGCHGSDDNAAPPRDLAGGSSTSDVGVGAHQTHLAGGKFSRAVECSACHVVPASIDAPGHTDGDNVAEVIFAGVSVTGGVEPVWTRATETCSSTYCHGTVAQGGRTVEPVWTKVDGLQNACGSCHGLPPPPPHVANLACERCHTETAGPGVTIANREMHINGTVDIPGGPCNQCHGDETSYAPPRDLAGNTDTASPGVGAHRRHLDAAQMTLALPFSCDTCHELPPISTTHMSGATDLVFSGRALGTVSGAPISHQSTPSYSTATRQCSDVYCHGGWTEASNPSGGSASEPVWNQVDGSQVSCGGCHGFPPPPPHPASTNCQNCHPAVVNDQLQFVDLSKHVNGQVDFN